MRQDNGTRNLKRFSSVRPLSTRIELEGASVLSRAEIETFTTYGQPKTNSFGTLNAIDARRFNSGSGSFTIIVLEHSVAVITLNVR